MKLLGEGRTAQIYDYGDNKIVKLFYDDFASFIEEEFNYNKIVCDSNISTPIAYEIVNIDKRYGIVYQKLDGLDLGKSILEHPSKAKKYAKLSANVHAKISNTTVSSLPKQNDIFTEYIQKSKILNEEQKNKIVKYLLNLPNDNKLCHGDLHAENYIYDNNRLYAIDWMTAYCGHPAGDIARTMLVMNSPAIIKPLKGYQKLIVKTILNKYNRHFLKEYFALVDYNMSLVNAYTLPIAAIRLSENIPHEKDWLVHIINSRLESM